MSFRVPIEDIRDVVVLDELVAGNEKPIIVTKGGLDRFACVRSGDFDRWEQVETRALLLERLIVAERERADGLGEDVLGVSVALREGCHGLA